MLGMYSGHLVASHSGNIHILMLVHAVFVTDACMRRSAMPAPTQLRNITPKGLHGVKTCPSYPLALSPEFPQRANMAAFVRLSHSSRRTESETGPPRRPRVTVLAPDSCGTTALRSRNGRDNSLPDACWNSPPLHRLIRGPTKSKTAGPLAQCSLRSPRRATEKSQKRLTTVYGAT